MPTPSHSLSLPSSLSFSCSNNLTTFQSTLTAFNRFRFFFLAMVVSICIYLLAFVVLLYEKNVLVGLGRLLLFADRPGDLSFFSSSSFVSHSRLFLLLALFRPFSLILILKLVRLTFIQSSSAFLASPASPSPGFFCLARSFRTFLLPRLHPLCLPRIHSNRKKTKNKRNKAGTKKGKLNW